MVGDMCLLVGMLLRVQVRVVKFLCKPPFQPLHSHLYLSKYAA